MNVTLIAMLHSITIVVMKEVESEMVQVESQMKEVVSQVV